MTVLESYGSEKAAESGHTEDESINRIEMQKYGLYCYCCGKKGHIKKQNLKASNSFKQMKP